MLFHNRDDHAKNFSLRLAKDRRWKLAPCYDLTFSNGPGGEHQMDVLGHGKGITRALLLLLAEKSGLGKAWAQNTLSAMLAVQARFKEVLEQSAMQANIRPGTLKAIEASLRENAKRLQ